MEKPVYKNYYVGRIESESEKAYNIGVWLPKSQVLIEKRYGAVIMLRMEDWLYRDKELQPLTLEDADRVYGAACIMEKAGREDSQELMELSSATDAELDIPCPENQDYLPFQRAGIVYVEKTGGRCIIGDEMGLGKTIQALGWLNLHPEMRPAVIVCPASVKYNWEEEAKTWLIGDNVISVIDNGSDPFPHADIYITNYAILHKLCGLKKKDSKVVSKTEATKLFKKIEPKVVIFDEAHRIKNNKAQRTKAAKTFVRRFPESKVLALTGTAIVNKPAEGWNLLHMMAPSKFDNWKEYVTTYCAAVQTQFGWDTSGASNLVELNSKMKSSCYMRRLKKDVLAELPDKRRSLVVLNRAGKNTAEKQLWLLYDCLENLRSKKPKALTDFEELRQQAIHDKMDELLAFCDNAVESEDKVIIFFHHKFLGEALIKRYPDAAVITGDTPTGKIRQDIVTRFQEDDNCRVFLGSITAAGEGITLTASSTIIFAEIGLTPGIMMQAEDRAHRIGQKNAVNIYWLLQDGSIEIYIAKLLKIKQEILDAALDGVPCEAGGNMFHELIDSIESDLEPQFVSGANPQEQLQLL